MSLKTPRHEYIHLSQVDRRAADDNETAEVVASAADGLLRARSKCQCNVDVQTLADRLPCATEDSPEDGDRSAGEADVNYSSKDSSNEAEGGERRRRVGTLDGVAAVLTASGALAEASVSASIMVNKNANLPRPRRSRAGDSEGGERGGGNESGIE